MFRRITKICSCLFLLGNIICWFLSTQLIFKNNILNFRYINYILVIIPMVLIVISGILILKNKGQAFALVFGIILFIVSFFAYRQLQGVEHIFTRLNENTASTKEMMQIIVLKDSPYENVQDIKDLPLFAPLEADRENVEKLLGTLKEKEGLDLKVQETDSYAQAYRALLEAKEGAAILHHAYEDILRSNDEGYEDAIRTIYTYEIEKSVLQDTKKKVRISNPKALNIYVSGIDTYGAITTVSRSDVNIIMTVNTESNKVLLTTTPRDAYVKIAGGGKNQYDKLTHSGIYGIDSSIQTLENLYATDIDYYVRINFTSFLRLIDLVGGVDVYNEQEFTSLHGQYHFPVGMVHLDADQALGFVRERYSLAGGDFDRGKNQQKVIAAIIQRLSNPKVLGNYQKIIDELSGAIQTDMPMSEIMELVNEQLDNQAEYQITSQALQGFGSKGLPSYAMPGYSLYMMQVDEESLQEVSNNIKDILEGK